MSFADIRAAIHTRIRTIEEVRHVQAGMPGTAQTTPMAVTEFLGGERIGSTNVFHWRFQITIILDYQGNLVGESPIDAMVPLILAAFSPRLKDDIGHTRATLGDVAHTSWFTDVRAGPTDGFITFSSGEKETTFRRLALVLVVKTSEEY